MPLLLLDLDNTLIDRDAAWRAGLTEFLDAHGLPAGDLDWIMTIDRAGHAPRPEVAGRMRERYGDALPERELRAFLRWGAAEHTTPDPAVHAALRAAGEAGWRSVVVTNGAVAQQAAKLRHSGLDAQVSGCVISEAVGTRKPGPEIFQAAADVVDGTLDGAWMVGDSAEADIAGAAGLGLSTVWMHRGRTWPADLGHRPSHIAGSVIEAIRHVIGSTPETDPRGPRRVETI